MARAPIPPRATDGPDPGRPAADRPAEARAEGSATLRPRPEATSPAAAGQGTGAPDLSPSDAPPAPRRPAWRRWAPLVLLLAGAALGWWLLGDRLSFETLRENRAALVAWRDSAWGQAAAAYVAAYVLVVAFSLPGGAAMTLAGGFLFGVVPATALTVVAATVGATAIFLAARSSLGAALERRLEGRGGFLARLRRGVAENEVSVLLTLRLVPAVPFFIANLAPAFLGVRTRTYIWTTFVGIIPGTAVIAWTGAGLGAVFDAGGEPDLGLIFSPQILGPLLALAALAALPAVLRAVRGRGSRLEGEG
ncbi:VTT domain-containing protein [Albimonas sp. CAU 1670]|uniref:TVP38/TMEM64 family protein n=1 Tax=Albimonas sp. CAU 1670 TaxID=3032599 RepID=UPI0023DBF9DA|nr:VTT domain-containing protein [Albimonas sp. CAU 1670]MDF2234491.1 VTT domain-containing protein [Albimonas sp. CAU 1670]